MFDGDFDLFFALIPIGQSKGATNQLFSPQPVNAMLDIP